MKITIYVLIAVAWLIYNIVKAVRKASEEQKKKKPQASPATTAKPVPRQQDDVKRTLEELMRANRKQAEQARQQEVQRQLQQQKEIPAKPLYQSQEVLVNEAEHDSESKYNNRTSLYESQEYISEEIAHYDNTETVAQEIAAYQQEEETQIDFDLRKALIYSEILRRPYA